MKKIMLLMMIVLTTLHAEIITKKWTNVHNTSFAIVVDKETYENCNVNLYAYKEQIEMEGLSCYVIIIDNKTTPLEIRAELEKLYNSTPKLEGAVFIGDIPIPMLRDAQHLTSAYKKNQSRGSFFDTSVPSDRFYEDFDLKFNFIKQDSIHPICYYYSLKAESVQTINKEIYSGRIKAPVNDKSKYDLINNYLTKVINYKKNKNKIDNMLVYLGHGYISGSLTAWNDNFLLGKEQFPLLYTLNGSIKNLRFDMSNNMKKILMRELEKPELDIAMFHAHGGVTAQYILEYPNPKIAKEQVKDVKLFLRHKLRSAKRRGKDLTETKNHFINSYGVTEEWFEGAFVDSVKKADSLLANSLDIYSKDLELFSPNAKFILFNQCFNGAFQEENYIAGKYLFDEGDVISSTANTVNVLQDIWATKFLDLFDLGVSVGRRHLFINNIENHIIGDPTLTFETTNKLKIGDKIIADRYNASKWSEMLHNEDSRIRALAVAMIYNNNDNNNASAELKKIYNTDNSVLVRKQCLYGIAQNNDEMLKPFLLKSIKDPSAFIRKVSAKIIGRTGDSTLIPILVNRLFNDQCRRVSFNIRQSLIVVDADMAKTEFWKYYNNLPKFAKNSKVENHYTHFFARNKKWLEKDIIERLKDNELELKRQLNAGRTLRNYNFVNGVEAFTEFINDEELPEKVRVTLIEAMGWFHYSIKKDFIINALEKVKKKTESKLVSNEALKSINRLKYGLNTPLTP